MNPNTAKTLIVRNAFFCAAAIVITSCGTATFSKTGSNAQIESLRNFELAFIDEFAVPGKRFNAAAFDAKVNQGNAKFQQATTDEKFTARRPVLVDLEERLVLLKKKKIDREDFNFFVENQKRDLRVFVDSQPAQSQERAEKLTLHILEIAATKVVPVLIMMI